MNVTRQYPRRSMLALFLLACCLALGSAHLARGAAEEPSKTPSFAACQRYAAQHFASVQLLEEDVKQEKHEAKAGSQSIGMVLSGHGIWEDKTGGPSNVRFLCLLETFDKPVVIHVMKDGPRDPVGQIPGQRVRSH